MFAMGLVDTSDSRMEYGIVLCNNKDVSEEMIQKKIEEIKKNLKTKVMTGILKCIRKYPFRLAC